MLPLKPTNITAAHFAAAADLSLTTVRSLIAKGDLHVVRLGRNVRIPLSEFTRLGLDPPDLSGLDEKQPTV